MVEQITMKQKPQVAQNSGNENVCTVCHGTGWEIFYKPEELYGGAMTEFARRCPRCSGKIRGNDLTSVPPQYRDADIGKFNFAAYSVNIDKIKKLSMSIVNDFDKWDKAGKGLYLWSKTPGSGKTFLACCIAKSLMVKYNQQMRFITAPDYIAAVGESYKRERGECDNSEVFRNCKILVMDDMGAQSGKEWQQQELFRIINKRLSDGRITIYTSNMPPEQLNVEDRTIDRIIKSSVTIQMPEEGIRLKKAASEQEHFLKEVVGV